MSLWSQVISKRAAKRLEADQWAIVPRSALQTDLQGGAGTMLKTADDTHIQLLPSCC
ncbi:hypothetical protein Z950_3351 [Sulfitobacter mediterraneus KCTC 32188]|nr:hypothetical protein Z950_3351 [Sulfitobacter mediterraneus KCTC 32188]